MNSKIVDVDFFHQHRDGFKKENKIVVLCHGVFDLLHYGHIEHLQEAKSLGDVLVVSVTASRFVNKGPGRPYFNDEQRMRFLASLACVDYVILSEAVTVHDVVKAVQPDIYVKGQEYAVSKNDVTGNIDSEKEIVERYGGKIRFTNGEVHSSTKLLNNFFGALPENVVRTSQILKEKYGADVSNQLRKMVDGFSELRVLVIGDIIIDEYVFCKVQGLTTKDAAMSTRFESMERYAGGALAIARHLAGFAGKVTLLSMMGMEKDLEEYIHDVMNFVECRIVQERNFITPVKRRYLKMHPLRQIFDKLFSVNHLLELKNMRQVDYGNFYRNLEQMLPRYDMVVVCDYGHGLLGSRAIRLIEEKAQFLVVNCQANSANFGMNVITKYRRADAFVVDERELRLPFGQSLTGNKELLEKLAARMKSRYAWTTLGAHGALGLKEHEMVEFPAVTLHVKDTVGAGDAFYSLAALSAVAEIPVDLATLVANIAGGIKSNLVGNSQPIQKVDLLKFMGTILNV